MKISFKMIKKSDAVERWLEKIHGTNPIAKALDEYAQEGVAALAASTPVDTGKTASSWRYEVEVGSGSSSIYWINDNVTYNGDPIVILLQHGHGTGTGGYVAGRDFINPAMRPVFDSISEKVRKVVIEL